MPTPSMAATAAATAIETTKTRLAIVTVYTGAIRKKVRTMPLDHDDDELSKDSKTELQWNASE
jgi:hypothetical protein